MNASPETILAIMASCVVGLAVYVVFRPQKKKASTRSSRARDKRPKKPIKIYDVNCPCGRRLVLKTGQVKRCRCGITYDARPKHSPRTS